MLRTMTYLNHTQLLDVPTAASDVREAVPVATAISHRPRRTS
jgi:hypothetical protein